MTTLYITSYGKNDNHGIYQVNFDNNKFELLNYYPTLDFPSYAVIKNDNLYVSYKKHPKNSQGGGIGIFEITDKLTNIQNYYTHGRSYTHLCLNDNYLFAANYHAGSTASYNLNNHKISNKIGAVHHTGLGPDLLKRQTTPHVHYVGFTPDKKYLYAVDLGADKIVIYDYINGVLEEDKERTINVVPGSGPRHMIFSQDGKYAYLVNEISNQLMVFKYQDGRFSLIQAIRTSPRHFKDFNAAAAIRLSNSGKNLFISNRGHDSIALYRVNQTSGKVTLLYMVHTGKEPRDFNIIDDKYIIVGAQGDNRIELLTFNEETESLETTGISLEIPQPVCITFKE